MKIKSYIAQPCDGLYKLDEKTSHKYYTVSPLCIDKNTFETTLVLDG